MEKSVGKKSGASVPLKVPFLKVKFYPAAFTMAYPSDPSFKKPCGSL
jgi:hypothetical protein